MSKIGKLINCQTELTMSQPGQAHQVRSTTQPQCHHGSPTAYQKIERNSDLKVKGALAIILRDEGKPFDKYFLWVHMGLDVSSRAARSRTRRSVVKLQQRSNPSRKV